MNTILNLNKKTWTIILAICGTLLLINIWVGSLTSDYHNPDISWIIVAAILTIVFVGIVAIIVKLQEAN